MSFLYGLRRRQRSKQQQQQQQQQKEQIQLRDMGNSIGIEGTLVWWGGGVINECGSTGALKDNGKSTVSRLMVHTRATSRNTASKSECACREHMTHIGPLLYSIYDGRVTEGWAYSNFSFFFYHVIFLLAFFFLVMMISSFSSVFVYFLVLIACAGSILYVLVADWLTDFTFKVTWHSYLHSPRGLWVMSEV